MIDRENVSAHALDFETKLETSTVLGGFIGNSAPPPPPVYAPGEREAMGSRAVVRWDGWGQWQLSTAETRTDWRSDRPVVLDVPSAAIFSLQQRSLCGSSHATLLTAAP